MKPKAENKNAKNKVRKPKVKATKKRKLVDPDASSEDEGIHLKDTRPSDEPVPKKVSSRLV